MTALTPIDGPQAWLGSHIDLREEGVRVLAASEIDEIDAALRHLNSLGEVDFPDITAAAFPLPTLAGYFASLADELHRGRGFLLLRRRR